MPRGQTALVFGAPGVASQVANQLGAAGIVAHEINENDLKQVEADPTDALGTIIPSDAPDFLVIIAGSHKRETEVADWPALVRAHLRMPHYLLRLLVPSMAKRGGGLIVVAQYLPWPLEVATSELAVEEVVAGTRDLIQDMNSRYGSAGVHAMAMFIDARTSREEQATKSGSDADDRDPAADVIVWCCTNRSASSITEMRVGPAAT